MEDTENKGVTASPNLKFDLKLLAREYTVEAVQTLAEIARKGTDERARIVAATALLDRGWGKPTETIKADIDSTIRVELKYSNPAFNTVPAIEDVTPKAIESTPPNTAQDVAAARQSHLDANKAAREHDSKNPKPWLDKPPEPKAAPGVVFRTPPTPGTAAAVEASLRSKSDREDPSA